MKFQYHEVKKLPIIVFDDFYEKNSCDKIWQELCFLNSDDDKFQTYGKIAGASIVNSAGDNVELKNNRGIWLDQIYTDRNISSILKENRKIFSLSDDILDLNILFRYLKISNYDSTLISYYEDKMNYASHYDMSIFSFISFFYENPKTYTGGKLIFEDGFEIDCNYNQSILFPSVLFHSVEPVIFKDKSLIGKNLGRYSITQFITLK